MKALLKTAGPRPDATGTAPVPTAVPAAQAIPTAASVTVPPGVPTPAAAAPVPAPVVKTPEEIEAEEFAAFKKAKAAREASTVTVPAAPTAVVLAPAPNPAPIIQVAAAAPVPGAVTLVPTVSTEIVTPEDREENRQVTTQNFFGNNGAKGGMEGDWDQSNLILPRLQVVQGSGQLSQRFPGGSVIIADEIFLQPSNAQSPAIPINFVPIQNRKQFRERVDQNSGLKARIAFGKDEVRALGGTTEWGAKKERPTWEETARLVMLVQQPEGIDHPAFSEIEGLPGKFAVLVYYASGVSFKHTGEVIATAAASTLRVPTNKPGETVPYLPKRWWRLTCEARPWGRFSPFAIVSRQTTAETDATVRSYCNGFLNRNVADDE